MDEKLRLYVDRKSNCCGKAQILVLSRPGGFIAKNCSDCGIPRKVGLNELPPLRCDECDRVMDVPPPDKEDKNYYYSCSECGIGFHLFTRLPTWSELFDYCGLATPNEGDF